MSLQTIKEVTEIALSSDVSASLRFTKYASVATIGKDVFKNIGDWVQRTRPLNLKFAVSEELVMELKDKLIINQTGGVLESGICLDRNYGCPYIPGSAVKGAARHAAWQIWQDQDNLVEKKKIAKQIATTFGFPTNDRMPRGNASREKLDYLDDFLEEEHPELFKDDNAKYKSLQGSVSFIAAYPIGKAQLDVDVLTCHHMDYYAGRKEVATDDENPNPQFFPVVKAGVSFRFIMVPLRGGGTQLKFAKDCLKQALEINGIGAKTAAGYGWFEIDQVAEKMRQRELDIENAERVKLIASKMILEEQQLIKDKLAQDRLQEQNNAEKIRQTKIDSASEAGLASLKGVTDFGKINSFCLTLKGTSAVLSDTDSSILFDILKQIISTTSKKEKKKWVKVKKGHWEKVGKLVSSELRASWFQQLMGDN